MDDMYNNCNDDSNVNKVTLEYLMNPQHFNKYINEKNVEKEETRNKDKIFYKKRIIFLTKQMLKDDFPNNELRKNFEDYLDSLIDHFKIIDKQDILQEEYKYMNNTDENNQYENNVINNEVPSNNLILNTSSRKIITMDNFVTKTSKKKSQPILPVKKNIDLKNPELRKKGIKKKEKKKI